MAPRAWASVIRKNVRDPADAEAARDLLLARVGGTEAGRHRQVDQRVHGEGHDQDGAAEALHPGPQRGPAEAHHEVGDRQRHHDQHRPDAPPGQVGPLDAPGGGGADDGAQDGHDDGQPDRVPQQVRGQAAEDQVRTPATYRRPPPRSAGTPAAARAAPATRQLAAIRATGRAARSPGRKRPRVDGGACQDGRSCRLARSQQPGLAHQADRGGPGAEFGDRDRVGLELVERASRRPGWSRPRRSGTRS